MATPNPATLKATVERNLRFVALAVARHPQTGRLFLGGSDFAVTSADPADPKFVLKELGKHDSYVTGLALVGKQLISGSYDGRLIWWDADTGSQTRTVEAHAKWIRHVVASPDGRVVASVADDMVCRLWDPSSGKMLRELRGHKERTPNHFPSMLYACTFSADGKLLATGDKVGHVAVWDVASGKELTTLEAPGFYTWDGRQRIHSIGGIRSLAFSPDSKTLAIGGIGRIGNIDHLDGPARIELFDWQQGKATVLFDKTKFKGLVNRLVYQRDGAWLFGVGGAGKGLLVVIDARTNKVVKEEEPKFHVHALAHNDAQDAFHLVGHNGYAAYEMKA